MLIDKLNTVDMKLWNAQDIVYEIRHMTFEQYKEKYFTNEDGAKELWEFLKKATDLNLQRNQIIDEIDEKLIEIIGAALNGENLDEGKFIPRKHKTY
jgi:hypothetical protein